MNIRAYLSYRRDDVQDEERDNLRQACREAPEPIELIYDENGTSEGANFVDFMKDDLTGARFLIIFLSPDYFTTAYTLYEFLTVAEYASRGLFLHFTPVRATSEMTLKSLSDIREKILYDTSTEMQAEIEELSRLRHIKWIQDNDAEIRQEIYEKIEQGWQRLIVPALERILPSQDDAEDLQHYYCGVAQQIGEQYKKSLEQIRKNAPKRVSDNLNRLLNDAPILKPPLKEALGALQMSDKGITPAIVAEKTMRNAVYKIINALETLKAGELHKTDHTLWQQAVNTAKQMAGWLVLLSLSDNWWVHNEHLFRVRCRVQVNLSEDHQPYGEVIISRSVLRAARFQYDVNKGRVIPARRDPEALVLDGGKTALMSEVLTPIFKELRAASSGPDNVEEFQKLIILTIEVHYEATGRPCYFLITGATYKMLEDEPWFAGFTNRLAGKLIFIVIDVDDPSCGHDFCKEDISQLLEAVVFIYRQDTSS